MRRVGPQLAPSRGSRKQAKWASLFSQSVDLHSVVDALQLRVNDTHPADWVAAYLLCCLNCACPHGCLGGKRADGILGGDEPENALAYPSTMVDSSKKHQSASLREPSVGPYQLTLGELEALGLAMPDRDRKKLQASVEDSCVGQSYRDMPVLEIWRRFELRYVPGYVNSSLSHWGSGRRPLVLMLRIPSPSELLQLQSSGRRCVTCLCQPDQLGREFTDEYPPYAVKDAFHFAIHDLQHAEKFAGGSVLAGENYYMEQVGLLSQLTLVWDWLHSARVAKVVDQELMRDMAHLVSDMNTASAHMVDFLRARWEGAARRQQQAPNASAIGVQCSMQLASQLRSEFANVMDMLTADINDSRELRHAGWDSTTGFKDFDSKTFRTFFHNRGIARLVELGVSRDTLLAAWPTPSV